MPICARTLASAIVALCLVGVITACDGRVCNAGDTQECTCDTGKRGSQVCNVLGTEYESCVCMRPCELYAAALQTCYDGLCEGRDRCAPCDAYVYFLVATETCMNPEQTACNASLESFNCADARDAVGACIR